MYGGENKVDPKFFKARFVMVDLRKLTEVTESSTRK